MGSELLKGEKMQYDYLERMKSDIKDYINDNLDITAYKDEIYDLKDSLINELFNNDSITGNASGSYTFNSYVAREFVIDNLDLLEDACDCLAISDKTISEKFLANNWEYFDVIIRCYLLPQAIDSVISDLISNEIE